MTAMQARLAKPGKRLGYVVLPSKDIKYVIEKTGAYFLEPKKGLTLNNQATTTEQQLKDGDRITLVEGFLGIKYTIEWVFQSDPVKAKADRIASEKAQGKIPALPSSRYLSANKEMVSTKDKNIPWSDLEKVLFWKLTKGHLSIGPIAATADALNSAAVEAASGAREYDMTFGEGTWDITFVAKDRKNNMKISNVGASDCLKIAQIIDFYLPLDLIEVFTRMAT